MTIFQSHLSEQGPSTQSPPHRRSHDVTAARARGQRAKLDAQLQARPTRQPSWSKKIHTSVPARNQTSTSIADAIEAYLQDHTGGNHSSKTLEWHATALGLLRRYLEDEQAITGVQEVD